MYTYIIVKSIRVIPVSAVLSRVPCGYDFLHMGRIPRLHTARVSAELEPRARGAGRARGRAASLILAGRRRLECAESSCLFELVSPATPAQSHAVRKWSAAAARAAAAAREASAPARAARCWWTTASGHRMYNFARRCIKLSPLDLDSRTPRPGRCGISLGRCGRRSAQSRLAGHCWHAGRPGRASC